MTDLHRPAPSRRTALEEQAYLLKRADDHRRMAAKSVDAGSNALHLRFQQMYEDEASRVVVVVPD